MRGGTPGLAASFQHPDVASAYGSRPPYPAEVFEVLESLMVGHPRTVLDIGAGDGALARPLAKRVDRVDAVDISRAMVDAGRKRAGGDRANLIWHVEPAETTTVSGRYSIVTAGASLHWMDWETTLRRVSSLMAPGAVLAIVDQSYHHLGWSDALRDVIVRHSRNPTYDPTFSLPDELCRQGLFARRGHHETAPMTFRQPVRDYVEQFHSTASLARALMPAAEAARFRDEVEEMVRDYLEDGMLRISTRAVITWGDPLSG